MKCLLLGFVPGTLVTEINKAQTHGARGLSSKFYIMFLYYFNLMEYTSLILLDYLDEGGGDSGILACKNS